MLIATEPTHPPHTHTFVISIAVFLCPLCVCACVPLLIYIYGGAVSYTDDLCVHTQEVRATHQIADVPTRVAPPGFSNCISWHRDGILLYRHHAFALRNHQLVNEVDSVSNTETHTTNSDIMDDDRYEGDETRLRRLKSIAYAPDESPLRSFDLFPRRRSSSARLLRPTKSLIEYANATTNSGMANAEPAKAFIGNAYMVINSDAHATSASAGTTRRRKLQKAPKAGGHRKKKLNEDDKEELFERLYRTGRAKGDAQTGADAKQVDVTKKTKKKKKKAKKKTDAMSQHPGAHPTRERFEELFAYGSLKNQNRRDVSRNGHLQYASLEEEEALEKHCTFRPRLAPMTRRMMGSSGSGSGDDNQSKGGDACSDFLNRNRQWMAMREKHLHEVKMRIHEVRIFAAHHQFPGRSAYR